MHRVSLRDGALAYMRPDDNTAPLLTRLDAAGLPVPVPIAVRAGQLLLTALPGVPIADPVWRAHPQRLVQVLATTWRALQDAGVSHGDLTLPNVLGDPDTGALTGIVDWGDGSTVDRPELDLACLAWSLSHNGYGTDVGRSLLAAVGWPHPHAPELARLTSLY